MKRKVVQLTAEMVMDLIREEKQKLADERKLTTEENLSKKQKTVADKAKETKEIEADEYADTLEKHIDMLKALKVKESKLRAALRSIEEHRSKLIKKISG